MALFASEGTPNWRLIYDYTEDMKPGDVVEYAELAKLLAKDGVPPTLERVQASFRDAMPRILKDRGRTFEAVKNVGYQMVDPVGHLRVSRHLNKRAGRQMRRSSDTVVYADTSGAPEDVKTRLVARADSAARILGLMAEEERRLARHAKLLGEL